ncbi:MAG: M10 family metallopeptidase C-terminal domain-containing protein [Hyphomicrobium sp.]
MPTISFTLDQAANQIATTGWTNAWSNPVSYGFRSSSSSVGFTRFTSAQITASEDALKLWSDVAKIKFARVGTSYTNSATILFSGETSQGGYGWGYFPGSRATYSLDGDVFINPSNGWFKSLGKGSYDFMSIIHEIGHAIGLDHPGDYNGGSPTYQTDALYKQDSQQYTVMSYFSASNTGAWHGSNYAATPLLHDIAAAQKMYGANWATRPGNTTYGFNSNVDRPQFHIDSPSQKAVFAIWDGGGNDTLNFSGYTQNGDIDLNQAAFSSVGGLKKNVAIAKGAIIENAIGGSGNDFLKGNIFDNKIQGGPGNDVINGRGGHDVLWGGSGADTFVFNTTLARGAASLPDFNPASETIRLENGLFKALGTATGWLKAAFFYAGAAAHDANDHIIYNKSTGELFYDPDGVERAGQIKFATLTATSKPSLSAADFFVV